MSTTIAEPTVTLSEQQIRQFHTDGYTVVRGLIPVEDTAAVRSRLIDLVEGNHDWPTNHLQILDPSKFRTKNGKDVAVGLQLPASRDPVFGKVADHPNLQSVMSQLLGGPIKRFTDQALVKNKEIDGQSFYHQDSYYWHLKPELGCNSWIALDHVGKDAIALGIMPGTHKSWTLTEHEEYFDEPSFHSAKTREAFKRFRIPFSAVDFSKEIILPMAPGDAAFFTNFTWHRAESNRTGQHKCAYAIAYQKID